MRPAVLALVVACACRRDDRTPPPPPSTPPSPRLTVAVDRRIELMSIVFRLAGRPRYTDATTPYARAVDRLPRDRPVVVFSRQLGERHGIGYEMAPVLAVHLDDRWQPRRALEPLPSQLARWSVVDLPTYLDAVRDFARPVDELLAAQHAYVAEVEAADRAWIDKVPVIEWFDRAFGPRPHTRYHLVPGLLTGPMDYAAHVELPDGTQDVYVIAHLDHPDARGVPAPTAAALPFVVHELGHSYINSIVDAALGELGPLAAPAIARAADAMRRQAYVTDAIVLEESVVRAVVVLWLRDRDDAAAEAELATQERLGFAWIRRLVDALAATRVEGAWTAPAIVTATRRAFER